ncbi:AmiR/NasT family two-component response regulator [Streptomyces phaeochromogenes]|uniref:ANTAR domain-containing response regulator n=1 Tax=Streptomyces phaeochromogenes TaxID=1923 RepID=UPI00278CD6A3|nr:ANTAR domain-containing protein [Streptomyces phaeochromogenes]MDQ0955923.1 AmiR/NasT family two-component response regulator [Streptomyces phaeochromogenes]
MNASACHGFRSRLDDDADFAGESVERWRREAQQLRRAMESRPTIDMARGILMTACSCSPDDAWELLVAISQNSNTKLREVAEAVVATTTRQEPLPKKFQQHLATALAAGRRA